MIPFGFVKLRQRDDLGDDRAAEPLLCFGSGLFRRCLLCGAAVKNYRPVLRSGIVALPIEGCWIMSFPKCVEDFFVRNHLRVIFNLDDFRMTRLAGTHLFVSWAFFFATRVTAGYGFDSRQHLINGFGTPETTAAKRGQLRVVG